MPYAFDTNDMRFQAGGNFVLADHYAQYCIDAFDMLWREADDYPAMMLVAYTRAWPGGPAESRDWSVFSAISGKRAAPGSPAEWILPIIGVR